MVALAGPYFMFATLLVVSGLPKILSPKQTATALAAIGLPNSATLGRGLGLAEIVIGLAVLLFGGKLAALAMGVIYVSFSGFVVYGLATTKVKSCGCFAADDTPPSLLHLAVDLSAAAVAFTLAWRPIGDLVATMAETPWAGLPLAGLVVVGAWLAYLVLTLLPPLFDKAATSP